MPRRKRVAGRRTVLFAGLFTIIGLVIGLYYSYTLGERSVSTGATTFTKLPETRTNPIAGKVGPYEGLMASDFTVETVDGRRIQLQELRGRTVVLWFMAAWCPSCQSVASTLKSVAVSSDVEVVVVDIWTEDVLRRVGLLGNPGTPRPETPQDLITFIKNYGDTRWHLVMDNWWLTGLYQLRYVDSMFVIDKKGVVVLRSDGPAPPPALRQALSK